MLLIYHLYNYILIVFNIIYYRIRIYFTFTMTNCKHEIYSNKCKLLYDIYKLDHNAINLNR